MRKWIEKWTKSADDKAIEEDGALNKWVDPKDGLPSTDREVTVLTLSVEQSCGQRNEIKKRYKTARFNPAIGWIMEGASSVILWRDEDPQVSTNVRMLIEAMS